MTKIYEIRVALLKEMIKYAEENKEKYDYEYEEFMRTIDKDLTLEQIVQDDVEFRFILKGFGECYE